MPREQLLLTFSSFRFDSPRDRLEYYSMADKKDTKVIADKRTLKDFALLTVPALLEFHVGYNLK